MKSGLIAVTVLTAVTAWGVEATLSPRVGVGLGQSGDSFGVDSYPVGAFAKVGFGVFDVAAGFDYYIWEETADVIVLQGCIEFHVPLTRGYALSGGPAFRCQTYGYDPAYFPGMPDPGKVWEKGLYAGITLGVACEMRRATFEFDANAYYLTYGDGANPGADSGTGKDFFIEPALSTNFLFSDRLGIAGSISHFRGLPKHPDGPHWTVVQLGPVINI